MSKDFSVDTGRYIYTHIFIYLVPANGLLRTFAQVGVKEFDYVRVHAAWERGKNGEFYFI